nr:MAG TPA: Putative tail fiber protein fold, Tail fiber, receptor [Caudoviricetes sp.]
MSDFQGLPKTKNLNLNKPGYDNVADIMALNENADIIDAAIKTNIDDIANIKKGYVKTVNGVGVDSKGNVNVKEYTHPASGVTAGSYRKVTVDTLGHVTAGENPILAVAEGGTGADNATSALSNLGILGAIVNASVSGTTITFTKKDNTKITIDTQDTNNGIVASLLEQNGYIKFANDLILQWGRSTAATLNFSLSFQKFYCITTAQESWSGATFENTSWIARTNSSMIWPTYRGTNINYIAVGM